MTVSLPVEAPTPHRVVNLRPFVFAPVERGDILGSVEWFDEDGDSLGKFDLFAEGTVNARKKPSLLDRIRDIFNKESKDETVHE